MNTLVPRFSTRSELIGSSQKEIDEYFQKHLNDIACDNKEVDTTVYAKVGEIEDNFEKL